MRIEYYILLMSAFISLIMPNTAYGEVKKVAILEVVDKEDKINYPVELLIRSSLSSAITLSPGYEGYARTNIDQILKEQNFQRTGLVSKTQIKSLGKMMGAQYVLITEAAMFADGISILITANVVDVESGEIFKNIEDITTANPEDVKTCSRNIAKRLFDLKDIPTAQTPRQESPSRNIVKDENIEDDDTPFVKVEIMPSFQGGDINTFRNWVMGQIKYPMVAQENHIMGRVLCKFVIDRNGYLTNIKILQSPHSSLTDEVIRVLRLSPRWEPGLQRNKFVHVTYTIPVDFIIRDK